MTYSYKDKNNYIFILDDFNDDKSNVKINPNFDSKSNSSNFITLDFKEIFNLNIKNNEYHFTLKQSYQELKYKDRYIKDFFYTDFKLAFPIVFSWILFEVEELEAIKEELQNYKVKKKYQIKKINEYKKRIKNIPGDTISDQLDMLNVFYIKVSNKFYLYKKVEKCETLLKELQEIDDNKFWSQIMKLFKRDIIKNVYKYLKFVILILIVILILWLFNIKSTK